MEEYRSTDSVPTHPASTSIPHIYSTKPKDLSHGQKIQSVSTEILDDMKTNYALSKSYYETKEKNKALTTKLVKAKEPSETIVMHRKHAKCEEYLDLPLNPPMEDRKSPVIEAYMKRLQSEFELLEDAIEEGNAEEIQKISTTFKSHCLSLNYSLNHKQEKMQALIQNLEEKAKSEKFLLEVSLEQFDKASKDIEDVNNEIKQELRSSLDLMTQMVEEHFSTIGTRIQEFEEGTKNNIWKTESEKAIIVESMRRKNMLLYNANTMNINELQLRLEYSLASQFQSIHERIEAVRRHWFSNYYSSVRDTVTKRFHESFIESKEVKRSFESVDDCMGQTREERIAIIRRILQHVDTSIEYFTANFMLFEKDDAVQPTNGTPLSSRKNSIASARSSLNDSLLRKKLPLPDKNEKKEKKKGKKSGKLEQDRTKFFAERNIYSSAENIDVKDAAKLIEDSNSSVQKSLDDSTYALKSAITLVKEKANEYLQQELLQLKEVTSKGMGPSEGYEATAAFIKDLVKEKLAVLEAEWLASFEKKMESADNSEAKSLEVCNNVLEYLKSLMNLMEQSCNNVNTLRTACELDVTKLWQERDTKLDSLRNSIDQGILMIREATKEEVLDEELKKMEELMRGFKEELEAAEGVLVEKKAEHLKKMQTGIRGTLKDVAGRFGMDLLTLEETPPISNSPKKLETKKEKDKAPVVVTEKWKSDYFPEEEFNVNVSMEEQLKSLLLIKSSLPPADEAPSKQPPQLKNAEKAPVKKNTNEDKKKKIEEPIQLVQESVKYLSSFVNECKYLFTEIDNITDYLEPLDSRRSRSFAFVDIVNRTLLDDTEDFFKGELEESKRYRKKELENNELMMDRLSSSVIRNKKMSLRAIKDKFERQITKILIKNADEEAVLEKKEKEIWNKYSAVLEQIENETQKYQNIFTELKAVGGSNDALSKKKGGEAIIPKSSSSSSSAILSQTKSLYHAIHQLTAKKDAVLEKKYLMPIVQLEEEFYTALDTYLQKLRQSSDEMLDRIFANTGLEVHQQRAMLEEELEKLMKNAEEKMREKREKWEVQLKTEIEQQVKKKHQDFHTLIKELSEYLHRTFGLGEEHGAPKRFMQSEYKLATLQMDKMVDSIRSYLTGIVQGSMGYLMQLDAQHPYLVRKKKKIESEDHPMGFLGELKIPLLFNNTIDLLPVLYGSNRSVSMEDNGENLIAEKENDFDQSSDASSAYLMHIDDFWRGPMTAFEAQSSPQFLKNLFSQYTTLASLSSDQPPISLSIQLQCASYALYNLLKFASAKFLEREELQATAYYSPSFQILSIASSSSTATKRPQPINVLQGLLASVSSDIKAPKTPGEKKADDKKPAVKAATVDTKGATLDTKTAPIDEDQSIVQSVLRYFGDLNLFSSPISNIVKAITSQMQGKFEASLLTTKTLNDYLEEITLDCTKRKGTLAKQFSSLIDLLASPRGPLSVCMFASLVELTEELMSSFLDKLTKRQVALIEKVQANRQIWRDIHVLFTLSNESLDQTALAEAREKEKERETTFKTLLLEERRGLYEELKRWNMEVGTKLDAVGNFYMNIFDEFNKMRINPKPIQKSLSQKIQSLFSVPVAAPPTKTSPVKGKVEKPSPVTPSPVLAERDYEALPKTIFRLPQLDALFAKEEVIPPPSPTKGGAVKPSSETNASSVESFVFRASLSDINAVIFRVRNECFASCADLAESRVEAALESLKAQEADEEEILGLWQRISEQYER